MGRYLISVTVVTGYFPWSAVGNAIEDRQKHLDLRHEQGQG